VLLSQHIGWPEIIRQGMQMNPKAQQQLEQAPPEQRERALAMQTTIAPITGYGGAIVGPPIGYLIGAAVILFMVRVIMSAPIRFKQTFAIFCYAGLPTIIQTILKAVVLFLKKPEEFNLVNPLAFNPAAFMDFQSANKFVYTIAKSVDVFTIWSILLIAVGLS